jgi:GNAT superfamily N-acetyltransferase
MNENSTTAKDAAAQASHPEDWIKDVTLEDGTQARIRPILPQDAPGLQAGFLKLSPQSVFLRFLETFKALSDKQARIFATVDYEKSMAFVAEIEENGEKRLIGVARYAGIQREGAGGMKHNSEEVEAGLGKAESAIVVLDEFQGRGLGSALMVHLIQYARKQGVREFVATVHMSNSTILKFIQRSGFPVERRMIEPGVWEITIPIDDSL